MRHRLLVDFQPQRVPLPPGTILDLIREQTHISPDAIAVTRGAQAVSYEALDHESSRVAASLQDEGIHAGDRVGLLASPSRHLPSAVLGVMKLGAVFVPIDELWPTERIASTVQDIDAQLLLQLGDAEPPPGSPRVLSISDAVGGPLRDFAPRLAPGAPAYGYFTSGSSGTPKCAVNTHRGLLNRFTYMTRRFRPRPGDAVLVNSRLTFDSSLWQLLWPLTFGGRVVIPRASTHLDFEQLLGTIAHNAVTMTDFVPTVLNMLVEHLSRHVDAAYSLRSLRHLLVGGEEISGRHCQRLRALLPALQITNTYGPTEAAIGMVFHRLTGDDVASVPIGTPIDNTHAVILDGRRELTPIGTIGELYIGGDCLGIGYVNDRVRTAESWVPNPFAELHGTRLYRTGDLAYHDDDGRLYFAGRADEQLKIAGIRAGAQEIEAALVAYPSVEHAAVIADDGLAGKELVAYVVAPARTSTRLLRSFLASRLPKSLIPRRFIAIREMPLTYNGKLDRHRLMELASLTSHPTGVGRHGGATNPPAKPKLGVTITPEAVVRSVWTDLLQPSEPFSPEDDFFAVGGDSLLAMRLLTELERHSNSTLALDAIYANPTLSQQIKLVHTGAASSNAAQLLANDVARDLKLANGLAEVDSATTGSLSIILATGTTGFVGAHVVADLLARTDARIACLTRSPDRKAAMSRVRGALEEYGLWNASFRGRLIPLTGDLESPSLGLSAADMSGVVADASTIVHCGGLVDLLRSYHHHRLANVQATAEVLRLCEVGCPKALHFVSSAAARRFDDLDPHAITARPLTARTNLGYGLSKWVAEQLVHVARGRGIKASIYRLGEVMPSARTGIPNRRSLVYIFLKACVLLDCYPVCSARLPYSPADAIGRILGRHIVATNGATAPVTTLAPPDRLGLVELLELFTALGATMIPVAASDFYRALPAVAAEHYQPHVLHGLLRTMTDRNRDGVADEAIDRALNDLLAGAETTGAVDFEAWPPVTLSLLEPFWRHVISTAVPNQRRTVND